MSSLCFADDTEMRGKKERKGKKPNDKDRKGNGVGDREKKG